MRVSLFTFLLLVLGPSLFGQGFSEIPLPGIPSVYNSSATSWADVNNDAYPDLLLSGTDDSGNVHTLLLFNNQDETFSNSGINLTPLTNASSAWGDLDNNGFIDLIMIGTTETGTPLTQCYMNDGLTLSPGYVFANLNNGSVTIFDFNNDGRKDVLIFGVDQSLNRLTQLYRNTGSGFMEVSHPFPMLSHGSSASIDYNNDGFIDLLLQGTTSFGTRFTGIFENNDYQFSEINHGFTDVAFGKVIVHDLNADGFEDVLYTGTTISDLPVTLYYQNQGNDLFSEINMHGLPNYSQSSVIIGDFDEDGLADVFLNGTNASLDYESGLFINNGDDTFSDSGFAFTGVAYGQVAPADFNLDTKLDLVLTGFSDLGSTFSLQRNDAIATNDIPTHPANLLATPLNNSVTLSFGVGGDTETPTPGLSYNLYVGTAPGQQDILNAESLNTGERQLYKSGNIHQNQSVVIDSLNEGLYYWSVQSVDNAFQGSTFATEESFVICHDIDLGPDEFFCRNDTAFLYVNSPGSTINWYSSTNGLLLANSDNFSSLISSKDTIVVEVNHPLGCVLTDSIVLDLYPSPGIDLGNNVSVCYQDTLHYLLEGLDSVNWYSTQQGLLQLNDSTIEFAAMEQDTLVAQGYNSNGCVSYDSIIISINPLPEPNLGSDSSLCFQENLVLSPGVFDSVNWITTSGQYLLNSPGFNYQAIAQDTITVEVFDLFGCNQTDSVVFSIQPLPDFSIGTDTSICIGETLTIDLGSQDSVNWFWENGSHIQGESILEYFVENDTSIIAEVYNSYGCGHYDTLAVHTLSLPQFNLGDDIQVCLENSIALSVSPEFEVNWHFEAEKYWHSNSNEINFEVTQSDTVIAFATDSLGCTNTDTLVVSALPLPDLTIANFLICENDSLEISIPEYSDVSWETLQLGTILENGNILKYPFSQNDTLIISTTNNYGCTSTDSVLIEVKSLPLISLPDTITVCQEENFSLNVPGMVSVQWGNKEGTLNLTSDSLTYSTPQSETLRIEATADNGCSNMDSVLIVAKQVPNFDLGRDTTICRGVPIILQAPLFGEYLWGRSSEIQFLPNVDSIVLTPLVNELVWLTITNELKCSFTDTIKVSLYPTQKASAGTDTIICFESEYTLGPEKSRSDWEYFWNSSTSLKEDELKNPNPVISLSEDETFSLHVLDENGCSGFDSVTIKVNPKIEALAGPDQEICFGEIFNLGIDENEFSYFPIEYEWLPQANLNNPSNYYTEATAIESSLYQLIAKAGNCEADTDYVHIKVNPLPDLISSGNVTIGMGESISLEVLGAQNYYWLPSEGLSSNIINNPIASPEVTTNYTIIGTSEYGCRSSIELKVFVKNDLFIPELFTPNNDGINDSFMIYGSGIHSLELKIYSTEGQLVFSSHNKIDITTIGWDGTTNGRLLEPGNYLWKISGQFYDGSRISYRGRNSGVIKLAR